MTQRKARSAGLRSETDSKPENAMTALSHRISRLSIQLICGMAAMAGTAYLFAGSQPAAAAGGSSPYFGRWTVSEDRPVFTARGRLYKTIDFAPCGRDFCGVSVDDRGRCGVTLFRFLMSHADGTATLHGHGRWGSERKNVQIDTYGDSDNPAGRTIDLYLGDGHDFGERSDNMPKFHGEYRKAGRAQCMAR
jgi:hypothetical protein